MSMFETRAPKRGGITLHSVSFYSKGRKFLGQHEIGPCTIQEAAQTCSGYIEYIVDHDALRELKKSGDDYVFMHVMGVATHARIKVKVTIPDLPDACH